MSITSYSFLAFAGGLLLLYYLIPKRFQWGLLLAASYAFYAFSGVGYLAYLMSTTLVTYLAGCKMGDLRQHQDALQAAGLSEGQPLILQVGNQYIICQIGQSSR